MKTRKSKIIFIFTILIFLLTGLFAFLSLSGVGNTIFNANNRDNNINYNSTKKNTNVVEATSTLAVLNSTTLRHSFTTTAEQSRIVKIESLLFIRRESNPVFEKLDSKIIESNQRAVDYSIDDNNLLYTEFQAQIIIWHRLDNHDPTTTVKFSEIVRFNPITTIQGVTVERYIEGEILKFRLSVRLSGPIDEKTTLGYKVISRVPGASPPSWPGNGEITNFRSGRLTVVYQGIPGVGVDEDREYKFQISGKYNLNGTDIDLGGSGAVETNWEKIDRLHQINMKVNISKDESNKDRYIIRVELDKPLPAEASGVTISLMERKNFEDNDKLYGDKTILIPNNDPTKKTFQYHTNAHGWNGNYYSGHAHFTIGGLTYFNKTPLIKTDTAPTVSARLEYLTSFSVNDDTIQPVNKLRLEYTFTHRHDFLQRFSLHLYKAKVEGHNGGAPDIEDGNSWEEAKPPDEINTIPGTGELQKKDYDDLEWNKWHMAKVTVYFAGADTPQATKTVPIFIGKKTPTPTVQITPKNVDLGNGVYSFEAKLENLATNDPNSAITSVEYKLWVANDINGTDAKITDITDISDDRSKNFEGVLASSASHPIDINKYYSVKATISYHLGDNINRTITPQPQSNWVKIEDKTALKVDPILQTENGNTDSGSSLSFKATLDNLAINDPREIIKRVEYRLFVSNNSSGSESRETDIVGDSGDRSKNFAAVLTSSNNFTIYENMYYSVKATVNGDDAKGGQSPWVQIVNKTPPKVSKPTIMPENQNTENGPLSFKVYLNNVNGNDPRETITSVTYSLWVSDSSSGLGGTATSVTGLGGARSSNYETTLASNIIDPTKYYSVKVTVKYDVGDGEVSLEPVQSDWISIQSKTPPTINKPIITPENQNTENGPLSFKVYLNNVEITDPRETITSVEYRLFVSNNSNGSGETATSVTGLGGARSSNYETTLASNIIDPTKYYSVKVTVNYDVGDGPVSLEPVQSDWISIQSKTPPTINKPIITPENQNTDNGLLSFKVYLNNVEITDPRETITSVEYRLFVSNNSNGSGETATSVTGLGGPRSSNYETTLASNIIDPTKYYSVKVTVNYDVGDGQVSLEPVQSDWVPIKDNAPPTINKPNVGLIVGLSVGVPASAVLIAVIVGLAFWQAKSRGIKKLSDIRNLFKRKK